MTRPGRLLKRTRSLCPEDLRVIDAELWERDGRVLLRKRCPEHGAFEDLYYGDYGEWERARRYLDRGPALPHGQPTRAGCPSDCGLCEQHHTRSTLVTIELTQRCNLRCPICFADAGGRRPDTDLSLEDVRRILEYAQRVNEPWPLPGVGNSGGEPTLRDDLPEIIALERELGFRYVLVITNGLRLAKDLDYFRRLRDLDVWIYLQFDGVSPEPYIAARGLDLWADKQRVIENARRIGHHKVVVVPTLARGVNEHQVGDIVRYAADNSDVIKFLIFQPVSFTGRTDRETLVERRITTSDVQALMEAQTSGAVRKSDFYPLSMNQAMARLLAFGGSHTDLGVHPHCGVVTLVERRRGERLVVPSRKVDNEAFYASVRRRSEGGGGRLRTTLSLVGDVLRYVDPMLWPRVVPVALSSMFDGALEPVLARWLPSNWLGIGVMHFMDPHNFDLERVQQCGLHFGVLDEQGDPRLMPFCTMNSLHRQRLRRAEVPQPA